MTTALRHVSRPVARRFLVLRHLLAPPRGLPPEAASVMRVVDRLGSLQFDPIDVAGRNHDLTLLSRIAGYRREWTDNLLYGDRHLYETYNKQLSIVPTAELPWYRVTWDRNRVEHEGGAFDEHAPLVEELLDRIRRDGPMSSTDVEPREAIDWYWRPTNQVRAILEALGEAGILGIARREGNRRVYDLVERLFPAELLDRRPSFDEQQRHRLLSRYRGNGLLGATGEYTLFAGIGKAPQRYAYREQLEEAGELVHVEVEGFRGARYVVTDELPILDEAEAEVASGDDPGGRRPGVAFLAPLDPLVWDRDLLLRLWDFDYRWEVYVPGPKRRWGYYVLPMLYGDRLVGRIELRADRAAKTLRVLGLWWEADFDPLDERSEGFADAFADALRAHLEFAGMARFALPRTAAHRQFTSAVRERLAPSRATGARVAATP
ncbi:MAG TPA: crosslink repair DNA glycosylase YcaQ family protein [Candidatus Limnocylindrales bacterium]|nr:crosslink repair DNA glycosylase YcaQ family protein [Candidatus Limnocylindrales bacterium]